jgi:hypothetical protein
MLNFLNVVESISFVILVLITAIYFFSYEPLKNLKLSGKIGNAQIRRFVNNLDLITFFIIVIYFACVIYRLMHDMGLE